MPTDDPVATITAGSARRQVTLDLSEPVLATIAEAARHFGSTPEMLIAEAADLYAADLLHRRERFARQAPYYLGPASADLPPGFRADPARTAR